MDTTHEGPVTALRGGLLRRWLAASLMLLAALVALVAALALAGGSHHARALAHAPPHKARPARSTSAPPPASATGTGGRAGAVGSVPVAGSRAPVALVRDPQESASFPAPPSVHHKAAAAPASAGELAVAAGAPSDAEVRQELAQMQAAEQAARRAQEQQLTAVKGGQSIGGNGTLPIPQNVPEVVQRVIAGANAIADFPYVFGGGHGSFVDNAYDCSGSVSYALAAGGLLSAPEASGELESWGVAGPGRYITVYANAGHTYMYVNGILYDTAGRSGVYASRWLLGATDNRGFVARHWPGL